MADSQKYTAEEKARHAARVKEREARKKERQKQKKALTKQAAPTPKAPATNGGHKTYDASLLKRARNVGGPPYEAFLKYLPHDCTEQQVTRFFVGCGPLEKAPRILKDRATGRVIRGFVTFAEEQGLQNALQKDGHKLGGRNISVTVATTHGTCQQEGTHTPAMASEVVDVLGARNSNGVFVDGTFGRGGHSREILKALGPSGRLHGFDVDEDAIQAGKQLEKQDSRFTIHRAPFSQMLKHLGTSVQGVLLDVGISSPQLDGGRGFRPEVEGPVDMRFDASEQSETALQYLVRASRQELAAALEAFGGERPAHARRIADAVALAKAEDPSLSNMTTSKLAQLASAAKGHREYQQMHPAKMTFQALRVAVNREFAELKDGLAAATEACGLNGAVAVLTWKHAECAVVVDFQATHSLAEKDSMLLKYSEGVSDSWGVVVDQARRPTDAELRRNSRARSAVLHVHRKARGTRLSDLEAKAGAVLNWAPHIIPVPAEQRAGCDRWGAGAGKKKKKRDETPEERKARKKAKKARRKE